MQKYLCSEILPLPRPLQANSTKSPPLPLVSHYILGHESLLFSYLPTYLHMYISVYAFIETHSFGISRVL
jgi:hypothetical protein